MKQRCLFLIVLLLGILFPFTSLTAKGQQEEALTQDETIVSEILAEYQSKNLSEEDVRTITEAFREKGLRGGPELDEAVRVAGFDPEKFKPQAPPQNGTGDGREPREDKRIMENQGPGKLYESLFADYGTPGFTVTSPAVENGELIKQFQCEKKVNNIEKSIPLSWENIPEGTKSLAVVMYHYPNPEDKSHSNSYLLLWGIDPSVNEIPYGEAADGEWFMGRNKDGNAVSYTSPCSPSPGSHEYVITLFALSDYPEDLPEMSTIDVDFYTFMDAIENCEIIGKAELAFKA
jgi:phosphatidylethanolamine-binding protein (PEBP) family uncharacterized protein